VARVNRSVQRELAAVRRSLLGLDRALTRLVGHLMADRNGEKPRAVRPRKPPTPRRRRAMVLQGRYIGSIRLLPARAKAEVRALRARKGVRAAIARARQLTRR